MATTRHVDFGDAIDAQDAVPLHQVQDIAAAAAAAAVSGLTTPVPLAGHAGFSILGKATTGSGNAADIPVGTDSVSGRIGSGNVGDISMTAAGRAMAGAASATAQTALLDTFGTAKGLVPGVPSDTTKFLRADGSFAVPPGTGAGAVTSITGDASGTGPGATAVTIAAGAVTNAKRANMAANTLSGNNTGSPAAPTDLTAAVVTAMLNQFTALLQGLVPASGGGTSAFLRADGTWTAPPGAGAPLTDGDKGDITVTGTGATWTIDAKAVTLAKMDDLLTDSLVGRDTAGTGVPERIGVTGGIEFDGAGNIRRAAIVGDVLISAGSAGSAIAAGVVTNAQLALVPTGTLKGRTAAGTGAPTDLTFAAVKTALAISFLDITGTLQASQFPALTGDVTTTAGSLVTALSATGVAAGTYGDGSHSVTIQVDAKGRVLAISAPSISITAGAVSGLAAIATTGSGADLTANSVSDAKLRQGGALSVIGRSANSTGNVADIASSADHQVLRREGTIVDFGQVMNGMIANGAITLPKHSAFPALSVLGNTTLLATDPTYVGVDALRAMLDIWDGPWQYSISGTFPTGEAPVDGVWIGDTEGLVLRTTTFGWLTRRAYTAACITANLKFLSFGDIDLNITDNGASIASTGAITSGTRLVSNFAVSIPQGHEIGLELTGTAAAGTGIIGYFSIFLQ